MIGAAPDVSQSQDNCVPASDEIPIVTDGEAIHDAAWFDEHPARRYRVRGNWVIRRCAQKVFLPTAPLRYRDRGERRSRLVGCCLPVSGTSCAPTGRQSSARIFSKQGETMNDDGFFAVRTAARQSKRFGHALARTAQRDWPDEQFEPYKWARAP